MGSTWGCLTGERHGEVLAEDCDFSISSGRSTLPPRIPRVAYSSLRPGCEGLDGAVMVLDALVPAPGQAQWIRFGLVNRMQVDERKIRRISMEKEDIDIVQINYTHIRLIR